MTAFQWRFWLLGQVVEPEVGPKRMSIAGAATVHLASSALGFAPDPHLVFGPRLGLCTSVPQTS